MSERTVKRPKRRFGVSVNSWVTPEQKALLQDRAAAMGMDVASLIRGALWFVILDPERSRTILANLANANAGDATSPSRSGCRLSLTTRSLHCAAKWAFTAPISFVRPSHLHYSMEVGRVGVTQTSEWTLSAVGGWHTLSKGRRCKSLRAQGLRGCCGKAAVLHADERLTFCPITRLLLSLIPLAKLVQRPGRPALVRLPRSGNGTRNSGAARRAYNQILKSSPITLLRQLAGGVS